MTTRITKVNPIAKDLRQPKYKPRVVEDTRKKKKDKADKKEIDNAKKDITV